MMNSSRMEAKLNSSMPDAKLGLLILIIVIREGYSRSVYFVV